MKIIHLPAGWLQAAGGPRACCHCLLVCDLKGHVLVDTGIGLQDVADPIGRVGQQAIDAAGFQFREEDSAVRLIERRGVDALAVGHVVLTHLDPDHAGGMADFPEASVHVASEELDAARSGDPRYRPVQWSHGPRWMPHGPSSEQWFGLEARRIDCGTACEILLVPLFGHTLGHCGVALGHGGAWTFHVGDAYYLRAELNDPDHPVGQLATARAADNSRRLASLERVRKLVREHADTVRVLGYHDIEELPR